MQYWINHNGVQSGPVDADAIREMGLTSSAYVWHEGRTDWVKITQVPELQGLFTVIDEPAVQGVAIGQPATAAAAPQPTAAADPAEPCPPTNLVWAIISTVLCCLPAGIVAIFYATKVSNRYREGDLEGAKRASEIGAWWCIAAIVLGILTSPLMSLLHSRMMSGM